MNNDILHKEKVNVSQSTKQWVVSIVLLINFIFYSLLFYFFKTGEIPNANFQSDDITGISISLTFFSIITLAIILSRGYSIVIDRDKLKLKFSGFPMVSLGKDKIKSFSKIDKRQYLKSTKKERLGTKNKRKKRKEDFMISYPNFVIFLKNNERIFVQTNKIASFEYAMNKMLNIKYV